MYNMRSGFRYPNGLARILDEKSDYNHPLSPLLDALVKGDRARAHALIDEGVDINQVYWGWTAIGDSDDYGFHTPLELAIACDYKDIAVKLMEHPSIDLKTNRHSLLTAAKTNKGDLAHHLLANGHTQNINCLSYHYNYKDTHPFPNDWGYWPRPTSVLEHFANHKNLSAVTELVLSGAEYTEYSMATYNNKNKLLEFIFSCDKKDPNVLISLMALFQRYQHSKNLKEENEKAKNQLNDAYDEFGKKIKEINNMKNALKDSKEENIAPKIGTLEHTHRAIIEEALSKKELLASRVHYQYEEKQAYTKVKKYLDQLLQENDLDFPKIEIVTSPTIVAQYKAKILTNSDRWLNTNPQTLTTEEKFELAIQLEAKRNNVKFSAYDSNLVRIHAFKLLKEAVLENNSEAFTYLNARLDPSSVAKGIPTKEQRQLEKESKSPLFFAKTSNEPVSVDEKDFKHQPNVIPLDLEIKTTSCVILTPDLLKKYDDEILKREVRSEFLTNFGWDKLNNKMLEALQYLKVREKETKSLWRFFGYSEASYNLRYDIISKLHTLKISAEEYKSEQDFIAALSDITKYIDDSLQRINRGPSNRFETILIGIKNTIEDMKFNASFSQKLRLAK